MARRQCNAGAGVRVLDVRGLEIRYGPVVAATDITLHLDRGEVVALIGPNGSGKTSILKSIMGLVRPHAGRVDFIAANAVHEITGLATQEIARLGVASVPSLQTVLPRMTVEENLLVGGLYLLDSRPSVDHRLANLLDCFPVLAERRNSLASSLSGGEQRQLAIARALMSRPRLLLLDEPSLGLSPAVLNEVFDLLLRVNREEDVDILIVEQNVRKALEISDRAYVMRIGGIEFSGSSERVADEQRLKNAYLGS